LARGKGCRVWDVDGNEYIDYIQGLLPNILGYAHPSVNRTYVRQLKLGHSFSLPHPLEVQLAEKLCEIIPCAEMVRFSKNGSDATSGAIRLARAVTGRDRVACCGYHGWQDWFIGSTSRHLGVPKAVRELTHSFPYNRPDALEKLLRAHPGKFAAVILEPVNFEMPRAGFLSEVRKITHRHGAILIFDEICSGFHLGLGGAQKMYGVTPDLACFGKAMGNGFPISCVVGRRKIMKKMEDIFFSFTFAGEVASMAASLETIAILGSAKGIPALQRAGQRLQAGIRRLANLHGLSERIHVAGHPGWFVLRFKDSEGNPDHLLRSVFQQEMVKRGVLLLTTHNMTTAHDDKAVTKTLQAYEGTFQRLKEWIGKKELRKRLQGPEIRPIMTIR